MPGSTARGPRRRFRLSANRLATARLAVALLGLAAGPAWSAPAPAAKAPPATPSAPLPMPDFSRQVMVTLPPGPERLWNRVTIDLANVYGLKPVYNWPLPSLGEQCLIFETPPKRRPEDIARTLAGDRRVRSAQPIYSFHTLMNAAPAASAATGNSGAGPYNDPYAHLQHGFEALHLPLVHPVSTGRGVKVGVIDTGLDFSHPDLAGRVTQAKSFLSWGDASFSGDVHGTAVAGVIAADANNGEGIVGVAPGASIVALKACWQDPPTSRQASCNSYTLAQAIDFALSQGVQILNFSLAGPEDPLLARMLARAIEQGVVVVAARPEAAGEPSFPASLPGVIAVGAATLRSETAGAGKGGGAARQGLVAPGEDILSTIPNRAYDFFSGSSLAAAQVTGVVALLLEQRPTAKPAELAALLADTGRPTGGPDQPETQEPRLIDACRALARLLGRGLCE